MNVGSSLALMVVHTHGHLDHRSGDDQFRALPDVEIVPTNLESVKGRSEYVYSPRNSGVQICRPE
jgi:glyoxylase-like metal-dependent hydrolase (beta-lactamase superfamily II)